MNSVKFKTYAILEIAFLIYACAALLSKFASAHETLSTSFVLFFGGALALQFFYAILWQQILKRLSLSVAYANKAVVILWACLFGALLFSEPLRPAMAVGAVLIVAGIGLVVKGDA